MMVFIALAFGYRTPLVHVRLQKGAVLGVPVFGPNLHSRATQQVPNHSSHLFQAQRFHQRRIHTPFKGKD